MCTYRYLCTNFTVLLQPQPLLLPQITRLQQHNQPPSLFITKPPEAKPPSRKKEKRKNSPKPTPCPRPPPHPCTSTQLYVGIYCVHTYSTVQYLPSQPLSTQFYSLVHLFPYLGKILISNFQVPISKSQFPIPNLQVPIPNFQ